MSFAASDLIPADQKTVRPFITRFGEIWFAVHVLNCADGLLSVHPSEAEAWEEIRGERQKTDPLVVCIPGGTDSEAAWFVVDRATKRQIGGTHASRQSASDARNTLHAEAAGDLCADLDGDLCCDVCGVSLGAPCECCAGIGYHRAGCPECES
jgi:hypothetical protein